MPNNRLAAAQRGTSLADATLSGPLLSPGSLTPAERGRLVDGIERVLEGVFTHLPLKRARYGFDPVQRLRILRTQIAELTDDAFHAELAGIVTRLRDAHTRYVGPASLASKVAALPFLVEMIGTPAAPTYVVTKVGAGLDATFKPGVVLEYWSGVPIDRAVQRFSDQEVGGRPDSQRAWATQSLTLRALQFGPPPDEHWVVVGYRSTTASGATSGPLREITVPWQVVDPTEIDALRAGGPVGRLTGRSGKALRRTRAVDPAASAVRQAKMLLFAPGALVGDQAKAPREERGVIKKKAPEAGVISTDLTSTLKALTIPTSTPGKTYGYLRVYEFDAEPDAFIAELRRLLPLLPDCGLIVDVRGNPGGYIWAAERALQLLTPNVITPTRFSVLATPFTREMAKRASLQGELGPWKASLDAAVRNGEAYSQPLPITPPADCNDIGQLYGGPVVLVGDATTYSAGDLFSAGFVDNAIGTFVCVGAATGAGGANVWSYGDDLRPALVGSPIELPNLPDGIGLSFSFRRATRAGPSEGLPIEDVGIEGTPYAMTRDDLLAANRDLIAHCVRLLRAQPLSRLKCQLDKAARTITVTTDGLDRLDVLLDGHPGTSTAVAAAGATTVVSYSARTRVVELAGFAGRDVRQRRRISVV